MTSKYKSPKSVAKNQTVAIDGTDPRLSPLKAGITKANIGAEIEQVGFGVNGNAAGLAALMAAGSTMPAADFGSVAVGLTYSQITNAISNPGPNDPTGRPQVVTLGSISNLVFTWSGTTLNFSFDFDPTLGNNTYVNEFILHGTATNGSVGYSQNNWFKIDKTLTHHSFSLTADQNRAMMGGLTTAWTSLCVSAVDTLGINFGAEVCGIPPAPTLDISAPNLTGQVTAINGGYKVAFTSPASTTSYNSIDIWEIEDPGSSAPTITYGTDGITPSNYKRVYLNNINPAIITTPNYNKRWVIARYSSTLNTYTAFSAAVTVTPTSPVSLNVTPPTDVTVTSAVWSGDNIVISYTLPTATTTITGATADGTTLTYTAANTFAVGDYVTITGVTSSPTGTFNKSGTIASSSSTQFTIKNTATGTYTSGGSVTGTNNAGVNFIVTLTTSGTTPKTGYFYPSLDGTGNATQTATITKADLFNQFGAYYSAFPTCYFKSISSAGIVSTGTGTSFAVTTRANPLSGITPTFTGVNVSNGYSLSWTPTTATAYAEVYQKYTSWSGITNPIDYFTGTFVSASGTSLVLTGLKDVDGNSITTATGFPTGYIVTGTGIPANTYVTATSYTSPNFTFTLNQSVGTSPAPSAGTYTVGALAYQGSSPVTIQETSHNPIYVIIRYYDSWDNYSNVSAEQSLQSINPVTVDLTAPNPVSAGLTYTSGLDQPTGTTIGFNAYILLSWTAITSGDIRGYKIRYTSDGGTTYSYADFPVNSVTPPSGTITYKLGGLALGASYIVSIATYDNFGNISAFANYNSGTAIQTLGQPTLGTYLQTGNGMQLGTGVNGNSANQGLFLNANNYWYLTSGSSASLKVGGSNTVTQTTSGITATGQALVLMTSVAGILVGQTVTGSASIPTSTTVTKINGNTITLSANLTGSIAATTTLSFTGVFTGLQWDGNNFSVDGSINARGGSFSGNIQLSTPGASIYNGTLTSAGALTGNGFIFNSGGLFLQGTAGSITLDSATGSITANSGYISNWAITANKIENTLYGSAGSYTGLAANPAVVNGFSYWAGSTSAGGDITNFAVTPTGTVYAHDLRLSGGSLDIGGTSVSTTATQATVGSSTIVVGNFTGITAGMYAIAPGIAKGTTVTVTPATTTVTLSAVTIAAVNGPIYFVSANGAHINSAGLLTATGATINGNINVTGASTFGGNINLSTAGSLYSGTLTGSGNTATITNGFILNSNGLYFNDGTVNTTTLTGSSLITNKASIGGWDVSSTGISKVAGGTGGMSYGSMYLTVGTISAPTAIYATSSDNLYSAGFSGPSSATFNADTNAAIWAGNVSGSANATSAGFYVNYTGKVFANYIKSTGQIISSGGSTRQILIDGQHDVIQLGATSQLFSYGFTGGTSTILAQSTPVSTADGTLNATTLNSSPYIALGPQTNGWGTTMGGIGLYSFNGSSANSGSYINVTTTRGVAIMTGDTTEKTGIILSAGKVSIGAVSGSGLTATIPAGNAATITMDSTKIQLNTSSSIYQQIDSTGIQIVTAYTRTANGNSAYNGASSIRFGAATQAVTLGSSGVVINGGTQLFGTPLQQDISLVKGASYYLNQSPMGPYPRQRMMVEDPVTGMMVLGMAVYYAAQSDLGTGVNPTSGGYAGDLWVVY